LKISDRQTFRFRFNDRPKENNLKHLNTFVISLLVVILTTLAASCGGSNIGLVQPEGNDDAAQQNNGNVEQLIEENFDLGEFPDFPVDEESEGTEIVLEAKSASVVSHPNHLAPWAHYNAGVDPLDPACYLLQGRKPVFTHVPKGPGFAYAIYKIHLGAMEADLLSMKIAGQVGAAGEIYFGGIANFTGMHWNFYGPEGAAPTWSTDMTTLGYDFTSAAGDMYVALLVPEAQSLHVTDITLEFKEREKPNDKPTIWNVWGKAYNSYATGSAVGGMDVIFRDIHTSAMYVTLADANGNWGMNLPGGEYDFWVIGNEMLLDVSGPVAMIDFIPDGVGTRLDLNGSGQMVYQGGNAVYTGSVVPMPLITANSF
jgi:hypothetical protein